MKLTCDRARWYEDSDGFWLAVRTRDRAAAAQAAQSIQDKPWEVALKEQGRRRSLDANAYCWVLLDRLSAVLGRPKEALYRAYVRDVGGNSETVCVVDAAVQKLREGWEHNGLGWPTEVMPSKLDGCTCVILYYGSSTYDSRQMARLIDLIAEDCRAQGIETKTPQDLAGLVEAWGRG